MLTFYNTIFILLLVSTGIQNLKMLSYYTKYYTKLKKFFSTYFTHLIASKIHTKISKIIQLTPFPPSPNNTIHTANSLNIFINFKNITVNSLNLYFYTPQEIKHLINKNPNYKDLLYSHYLKHFSLEFVFKLRILFFYKVNLHLKILASSISISTERINKFTQEQKFSKQYHSISIYFNSKTKNPIHQADIEIISKKIYPKKIFQNPRLDYIYIIHCNYNTMQNNPFNSIGIYHLYNYQGLLYPKNVVHLELSKSDSDHEVTTNYYNFKLLESNFKFNFNKKTLNDILFITKTIANRETSYVNLRHYLNLYTQYYNSPYSIGQFHSCMGH